MAKLDDATYTLQQKGNFFIMDSEQLISNPFHEMQQEAVNEAQKKNSMTEKLTIVKNNVCENHYQMAKSSLDRQQDSRLKQLHDHANRLRHEVKLLDLDRQRHTVEVKKRLEPQRDHSYDESQIHNTERRLGANIASFYLEKKLKYPTRLRSMKDIRVTPTISRARAKIRTSDLNKQMEESRSPRPERAQTAKTTSTAQTSSSAVFRRRGSRSAPLYTRNTRSGGSSKTLFPAIGAANRRAGGPTQAKDGASDSGSNKDAANHQQQVKFAFENPLKILASSEESANIFARSCSYYPGSIRAVNFGYDSSDEDELSEPDRIDLKAILFPDDKSTPGPTHSSLSQHQLWALRKAQGPAPKLTTTKKQEEANLINAKIDTFLEKLALARQKKRRKYGSDSDDSEDDEKESETMPNTVSTGTSTNATLSFTKHNNNNNDNNNNNTSNTKSTSTSTNLQVPTTTESRSVTTTTTTEPPQQPHQQQPQHTATNISTNPNTDQQTPEGSISGETPRKYSWRCIRGKQADGQLRGTYRTEDLVIQALTGVPISNAISTHVPMHSASRAMRHTATFKMHKIVEKLIHDRTKYERHQVEEIKRQQMESTDVATEASELSRRLSKATTARQMSR